MGHNSRLIKSLKSKKMKIFATLAAFALAQDGPDGRAMSLNKKIENAQNKCSVYMSKAYSCAPPSEKIGKYTFRLDKVLLDAKHHLKVGKCDVGGGYGGGNYRRKRETQEELEAEFDAVMAEINSNEGGFQGKNYGSSASQGQLTKLEGLCEKFINAVFNDDSLADCPKLGAWKNRSSAIFEDLVLMKNRKATTAAAAVAATTAVTTEATTEAIIITTTEVTMAATITITTTTTVADTAVTPSLKPQHPSQKHKHPAATAAATTTAAAVAAAATKTKTRKIKTKTKQTQT